MRIKLEKEGDEYHQKMVFKIEQERALKRMQRQIQKSGILDAFDQVLSDLRMNGVPQMRSESVYLGSLNLDDKSRNKQVAAPTSDTKIAKNKKSAKKGNQSHSKTQPVISQVDPNLHEDPDMPITGPGDIFEWAAYFLQDEYDRLKKDSKF